MSSSDKGGERQDWRRWPLLLLLVWVLAHDAYHAALTLPTGVDFRGFYLAAQRLNQKQPLYLPYAVKDGELQATSQNYGYPPLLAVVMRPVAVLPIEQAFKVWGGINIALLLLSTAMLAGAIGANSTISRCLLLLVTFKFWPVITNLYLGQCNFLLLLAVAGMFLANRHNKPHLVGAAIAFGALFKPWMIGLAGYLILRKRWSAAVSCAGIFAAGLLLSFLIVGLGEFAQFRASTALYVKLMNNCYPSQSLIGFAQQHFGANPFINPWMQNPIVQSAFVYTCEAAIISALFYLFWAKGRAASTAESQLQLALVTVALLLSMPLTDLEYLVLVVPVFCLVVTDNQAAVFNVPTRAAIALLYAISTRLIAFPSLELHQSGFAAPLAISAWFFWTAALSLVLYGRALHLKHSEPERLAAGEPLDDKLKSRSSRLLTAAAKR